MESIVSQTKPITMSEEEEKAAFLHAIQYHNSFMVTSVLSAGIELGVFEIIAKAGPGAQLPASAIASQLNVPTKHAKLASMLDRMLRLFVAHAFLTCSLHTREDGTTERHYGLAPPSKFLMGNSNDGSLAALLALSSHRVTTQVWLHVKDAIVEGCEQFEKTHGVNSYEYMNTDPAFNDLFNESMAGSSTLIMKKVFDIYRGFDGLSTLVDVGGGVGRTLNMIISRYPFIKGFNYDLPHVIQSAPTYAGIEHVGGDMFESIPTADAIMFKDALHNWSDAHCIKILKNCYKALNNNGKVIIISMITPEVPDTSMPSKYLAGLDYIMLMNLSGKERSEKEFQHLGKQAGFSKFEVSCLAYDVWGVIEMYK